MKRKASFFIVAALAAGSFSAGAIANDTFPLSVNESGPVYPQHAHVPANVGSATTAAPVREIGGNQASTSYEVRTPSSVSESAPWLTGTDRR